MRKANMLALIILIVFGLGTAYFATQNTGMVSIMLGNYLIDGIPLYIIVIASMLLGVFISWLVSIVDTFSTTLVMYGKDSELKKAHKEIERLSKENQDLTKENSKLQGNLSANSESENEYDKSVRPSLFQRVKHNFG